MNLLHHLIRGPAGFALCILMAAMLFFFSPLQSHFYPPCFFKEVTGLNCPGCGSARALHCLLHLQFVQAADYNLLVVLFTPVIGCGLLNFFPAKEQGGGIS